MEIKHCSPEASVGQGRNKERKDFVKFDENDHSTYPNLWDTMKAMLRAKFIAQNAYIKKCGENPTLLNYRHLKTLEQKEANSPRGTKRQEELSN